MKNNEIPPNEKTFENELLMEENKEYLYNSDQKFNNNNISTDSDVSNKSYKCLIQKIINNNSKK